MYVLRKAQKSVGRKKPSPQVVRLFEPHPGLAGCCTYIKSQPSQFTLPWCSSHSKLANKHHSTFHPRGATHSKQRHHDTLCTQPAQAIKDLWKGAFLRSKGKVGLALSCRRNASKQAPSSIYIVHCVLSVGKHSKSNILAWCGSLMGHHASIHHSLPSSWRLCCLSLWRAKLSLLCVRWCVPPSSLKIQLGWNGSVRPDV